MWFYEYFGLKILIIHYEVIANHLKRCENLHILRDGTPQTGGLVSASPATTADSYFYHSDHLGSSSLITNKDGDLVQHIQYIPFGEVFIEERNSTWSTPYKFNGKEQDEETGLCYYGARYYDPRTSVWLSVDPLAEKHPEISPYVYCAGNPVNLIDPDGRDWKTAKKLLLGSFSANFSVGAQAGAKVGKFGANINIMSYNLGVDGNGTRNSNASSSFSIEAGPVGIKKEMTYNEATKKEVKTTEVNTGTSVLSITNFVTTNVETTTTTSSFSLFNASASTVETNQKTENNLGQKTNNTTVEKPNFSAGADVAKDILKVNVSAIVGVDLKIDINKVWSGLKELVK